MTHATICRLHAYYYKRGGGGIPVDLLGYNLRNKKRTNYLWKDLRKFLPQA